MRIDVHSPSNFKPEHYTFVGFVYLGNDEWAQGINDTGAWDALHVHGWTGGNFAQKQTCDHCGAWFLYGAVFDHAPSNEAICVGHICANESFGHATRRDLELKKLKRRVAAERERIKAAAKAAEFMAANPGLDVALKTDHHIVQDIGAKLLKWGSISDKQIALVNKIASDVAERAKAKAIEDDMPKDPVVEGKGTVITGKVLATKYQDSQFGTTLKMLVRDDRGFKVWGTVPANIDNEGEDNVLRGKHITFVANTEVSKDDQYFGFFKRPRKCAVVDAA